MPRFMASESTGPIAVYGATGYTGRLVAAELVRRGAEAVLVGRNAAKLEIVAEDLGGVQTRVAPLDDLAALREALEPCAAVISCAGPFAEHGEPVLTAAIGAGTHYLDTTGEQRYMRRVFDEFGAQAQRARVALLPAMGFDYAPGDMLAAVTAASTEPVDELVVAYAVIGFGASRGTLRSVLGVLAGGDVEWRDGQLAPGPRSRSAGSFDFGEPVGRQRVIRLPAGEHLTVPRHVQTHRVRTVLTIATVLPFARLFAPAAPVLMPAVGLLVRTPARRAIELAIGRLPEGPSTEDRRRAQFTVVCEASAGEERKRRVLTGTDLYGLTARTTVEGALRCAAPSFEAAGALAPSQAFEPGDFLAAVGLEPEVVAVPAG
jgi:short subunit dehydrogenase-like uncharacterized protein